MFRVGDLVRYHGSGPALAIRYVNMTVDGLPYAVVAGGMAYFFHDLTLVKSAPQDLTDTAAYYAAVTE